MAAPVTPTAPPPATTGPGMTTGGGTGRRRAPPATGRSAPVIDSCAGTEDEELTVALSGHITF